jgi:hypothetical protein
MELCYARSQSMRILSSRKKIPELVSSVRTKAGPIEVTDPARRERDLLAKIIQTWQAFSFDRCLVQLVSSKRSTEEFQVLGSCCGEFDGFADYLHFFTSMGNCYKAVQQITEVPIGLSVEGQPKILRRFGTSLRTFRR